LKKNRKKGFRALLATLLALGVLAAALLVYLPAFGASPSEVQIRVYRTDSAGAREQVGEYPLSLPDWKLTIPNMPKYDQYGQLYKYEVEELEIGGYRYAVYALTDPDLDTYYFLVVNSPVSQPGGGGSDSRPGATTVPEDITQPDGERGIVTVEELVPGDVIEESPVPLASLPKTGESAFPQIVPGLIALFLAIGLIIARRRAPN